ncbi:hypothetical protein [Intrasporangium sp.]|uniref:hypothetical protein n=1 Tax=Intrasporangium sp. TaxID=1925024 RepID=UPI003221D13B
MADVDVTPGPSARVARALVDGRSLTRDLAADLLTHLPELGSASTQGRLDAWVEQASEALLAVSDALGERLLDRVGPPDATVGRRCCGGP